MEVQAIIKIKNPLLNFQKDIRYRVTKVNKTTVHCRVVEYCKETSSYIDCHYGKDYKGISINCVIKVCSLFFFPPNKTKTNRNTLTDTIFNHFKT